MIVLDEQLCRPRMFAEIRRWAKGTVICITDVRPQSVVLDDSIASLLHHLNQPTFVTINHRDFWRKIPAHPAYCVMCFRLTEERVWELPESLRGVLRLPEWKSRRSRMGRVLLVGDDEIKWYST